MIEAVIVSTARTSVGKAYRGGLNNTEGPTMAARVIAEGSQARGYRAWRGHLGILVIMALQQPMAICPTNAASGTISRLVKSSEVV
jgi:hypothetical protein